MCCFSGKVESVSNTNIFARSSDKGGQFLVYRMAYSAKDDLAMILPIPVPFDSADDCVRFIGMKEYAEFFTDMLRGFPVPQPPATRARTDKRSEQPNAEPLPVVDVGDFVASFVPSVRDFARLDERFRLPATTWDQLPAYRNYGFAVFKLKKEVSTVHPMAFEFPRANPRKLFLPTVHIHDGKVHARASFDHTLYCQVSEGESLQVMNWVESKKIAVQFININKAKGLVDAKGHVYQRIIRGTQKNEDILV